MAHNISTVTRRSSIPQELEDPDDMTVGDGTCVLFETDPPAPANPLTLEKPREGWKGVLSKLPKEIRDIVAGGLAGMLAKTVVAPVDRIKILYQVSSASFHILDLPRVAMNIVKNEGLGALWKGNVATMLRVFPYSGIQFMCFEKCRSYLLNEHEQGRYPLGRSVLESRGDHDRKWGLTPLESLVAGMIAGSVSTVLTYPLDMTRAQLAVLRTSSHGENLGLVGILSENYRAHGIPGLFRGLTPTLVGILPYSGIAFALNEQAKREIQYLAGRELTTFERMQCGAVSGLVAQTISYPIEVTRRRMQTLGVMSKETAFNNLGVATSETTNRPPTLSAVVRSLYAEQGIRGFFKGVSMNWMKGPIAFSISFTAFDTMQSMMETEAEHSRRVGSRGLALSNSVNA